ncbi:hypothetical protein CDD83_1970 [Cordyceps sp. RAO-2017]|nr:hypothetical protein CDD83_1970 [Cordyceps sp. RAO-2017]
MSTNHGSLVPPPPQRPLSAPQSAQQAVFPPPPAALQTIGSVQSQVAPPGQSLNDLSQLRLQQQYAAQMQQLQPAITGYTGFQPHSMAPFSTANPGQQQQFMQTMMTGLPGAGPFADPARPVQFSPIPSQATGYQPAFPQRMPSFNPVQGANGGVNSFLPPALEPQQTGMSGLRPQHTGVVAGGFAQPLQPQRTGPPPPVRFGVTAETKRLTPQPTGRRANLAQATPDNPFGF